MLAKGEREAGRSKTVVGNCACVSHSIVSDSCDPMDCSPPGSSVHRILQARILEWVAIPVSTGFSWPRDWTQVSALQADSLLPELPRKLIPLSHIMRPLLPDNTQPCYTPFPVLKQSPLPSLILTCFLSCIQVSQETGQVVWYSALFQNFLQFVVIHAVRGLSVVNDAEANVFLEFPLLSPWSNECW